MGGRMVRQFNRYRKGGKEKTLMSFLRSKHWRRLRRGPIFQEVLGLLSLEVLCLGDEILASPSKCSSMRRSLDKFWKFPITKRTCWSPFIACIGFSLVTWESFMPFPSTRSEYGHCSNLDKNWRIAIFKTLCCTIPSCALVFKWYSSRTGSMIEDELKPTDMNSMKSVQKGKFKPLGVSSSA